jgi:hypothetical protein
MSILSPGVHDANWSFAGVWMLERRVVRGSSACGAAIRRVRSDQSCARDDGDNTVTEYSAFQSLHLRVSLGLGNGFSQRRHPHRRHC